MLRETEYELRCAENIVEDLKQTCWCHESSLVLPVTVAMEIFNEHMPEPNQLSFVPDCSVTAQDLLRTPDQGEIT